MRTTFKTIIVFMILLIIFSYSLLIVYGFQMKNDQTQTYTSQQNELISTKNQLMQNYIILEQERVRLQDKLIKITELNKAKKLNKELLNALQNQTTTSNTVANNAVKTIKSTPVTKPVVRTVRKKPVRVRTRAS